MWIISIKFGVVQFHTFKGHCVKLHLKKILTSLKFWLVEPCNCNFVNKPTSLNNLQLELFNVLEKTHGHKRNLLESIIVIHKRT